MVSNRPSGRHLRGGWYIGYEFCHAGRCFTIDRVRCIYFACFVRHVPRTNYARYIYFAVFVPYVLCTNRCIYFAVFAPHIPRANWVRYTVGACLRPCVQRTDWVWYIDFTSFIRPSRIGHAQRWDVLSRPPNNHWQSHEAPSVQTQHLLNMTLPPLAVDRHGREKMRNDLHKIPYPLFLFLYISGPFDRATTTSVLLSIYPILSLI